MHDWANLLMTRIVGSNTHMQLTQWSFGVKAIIQQMTTSWHWQQSDHCDKCKCVVVPTILIMIVCLGRRFYVLPRYGSYYLSHMMPNLGVDFFPSGTYDGCAQLDHMDLERKNNACSMKKGTCPKMTSCGSSNFEGDWLHLNLLKKPQIFGSTLFCLISVGHTNSQFPTLL